MANLLDMLFGCRHKNCSFPITSRTVPGERRSQAAQATGTYIVCLDCGKEFAYDWKEMRLLSAAAEKRLAHSNLLESAESFAATNGRAA
jgi:hypothetical protein